MPHGYLKDNIMYEGVDMDKPEYIHGSTSYDKSAMVFNAALASAPQLPAIGFEGEGVRSYEHGWQKRLIVNGGEWVDCPEVQYNELVHYGDEHRRIVAIPVQEDKPVVNEKGSDELSQHKNISDEMIKESFDVFAEKHKSQISHFGDKEFWCAGAIYMREYFLEALLKPQTTTPQPRLYSLTAQEMGEIWMDGNAAANGGEPCECGHCEIEKAAYLHSKYGITPEEIK